MPAALLALAISAFGIGSTEFVIMGLLPQVAADFGVSIPSAGLLISGYALGVVVGAPLQARVMAKAQGAPALASAANIAAFNLGNAGGAWLGGQAIEAGLGYTAPNWIGAALAASGLVVAIVYGPARPQDLG